MSLSVGIVGLPNVGKSTLFKAITKKQVDCSNYPFCTIEPNIGVVEVPDKRVDKLAEITKSAKKIYSTVKFVDIAGLVEGANKGEGLGNQFLAQIREVDVIVYVLRCFKNEKIVNTQQAIDVIKDKEILDTEMALKDLVTVEKRIVGLEKEAKQGNKQSQKELPVLQKALEFLEKGQMLYEQEWPEEERRIVAGYQLLTIKPRFYLLNGASDEFSAEVEKVFKDNNWQYLLVDVLTELEASDFSKQERVSYGLSEESGLDKLIKQTYQLLGLITFLTTGPDETRAWDLKQGSKAPQAGGAIHTDFESSFIKAEVIDWQKLVEANGFTKARENGWIRTEGKDYIVKDGDVIEIKVG